MTWVAILALALLALLACFALKAPRLGREAIAAALVVGLAGYALQGQPAVPSAPRAADEPSVNAGDVALVKARAALAGAGGAQAGNIGAGGNRWVVVADALARHGQYGDAAGVLRLAVEQNPRDGEAWLAMANALVGHAGGQISPAALHAFREAEAADPKAPGPPFFMGLALARSGQLVAARKAWAELLEHTPPGAPWKTDLTVQLARLDAMIAEARAAGAIS